MRGVWGRGAFGFSLEELACCSLEFQTTPSLPVLSLSFFLAGLEKMKNIRMTTSLFSKTDVVVS